MSSRFPHPSAQVPATPERQREDQGDRPGRADRACCCPSRPAVTVLMPPTSTRPYSVDLLLCGHHFRRNRAALADAGAVAYDDTGSVVTATGSAPSDTHA